MQLWVRNMCWLFIYTHPARDATQFQRLQTLDISYGCTCCIFFTSFTTVCWQFVKLGVAMSPMSLFVVFFLNVARAEGTCSQNNKNINLVVLVKPWNVNTLSLTLPVQFLLLHSTTFLFVSYSLSTRLWHVSQILNRSMLSWLRHYNSRLSWCLCLNTSCMYWEFKRKNIGEGFVKNSSSTLESGHCCNGGLLVILYLTEGCAC